MGRQSQRSGKRWEQLLERWHAAYARHGVYVVHSHPPVVVCSAIKQGHFRARWGGQGPPDYLACVDGRMVVLEAKHTDGDRWRLSQLEAHQAGHLDQVERAGGLGVVLVDAAPGRWVLPWATLGPRWGAWQEQVLRGRRAKPGTASLDAADLAELGIPMAPTGWLRPVRSLLTPPGSVPSVRPDKGTD